MTDLQVGALAPDTKDWTWTSERVCPECGFDASAVRRERLVGLLGRLTSPRGEVLARASAAERSDPVTWSPLEYGCHVRDVCRLFDERTRLVLEVDRPTFANWDQDEAARVERYGEQDPAVVADALADAADGWACTIAEVGEGEWEHTGTRSNGSVFTTLNLCRYGMHDLAHHLRDVGATSS